LFLDCEIGQLGHLGWLTKDGYTAAHNRLFHTWRTET